MGSRRKPLEIEIVSTAKGDGFKESIKDADKWATKLGKSGEEAGDKLSKGLKDGVDKAETWSTKLGKAGDKAGQKLADGVKSGVTKANSAVESAGSTAADMFSNGFDVSSVGDSLAGGLGGMGGVFGSAAGALGVAAGAAFATGFAEHMEREVASDRLAAQLGGSEWAQSMGEVAGNLYAEGFGESVAETGDAVKRVVQNGLLPEDATNAQIENLSTKLLTFTDVLEQDVDMTTQAISNMMRTGIAESSEQALDILTRGVQQGADRAGDLAETFQEYSTMFRDAGLSAADATGLLVQGLQAGARDADTVADALKEFAIRGQDASETSAAGFKAIGLNAEEMTAMVAAGGPAARDALDQVLDGLRNMEDPAARNAAAVALFGTKAEDLGDALFNLDLDTATTGLGEMEGATDKLGEAYDNGASKMEAFKRKGLEALADFVGDRVIPALEDLGPVFDDIRGWVDDAVAEVEERWPQIEETVRPVLDSITRIIESTVDIATTLWENFGDNILAAVEEVWPSIQQRIQGTLDIITGIFDLFSSLLKGDWQGVWDALGQIVSGAWNVILGTIGTAVTVAKAALGAAWEFIKSAAAAAWEWIFRNVGNWIGNIVEAIGGLRGKIAEKASGMWNSLLDGAAGVVRQVQVWINRLIEAFNAIPLVPDVSTISIAGRGVSTSTSRNPDTRNQRGGLRQMAEGGIVRHRPGGIVANIGEGRYDEAVVPLKPGMGGLAPTIFNISFAGAIIASSADAQRWVSEALTKALSNDPRAVTVRGAPLAT